MERADLPRLFVVINNLGELWLSSQGQATVHLPPQIYYRLCCIHNTFTQKIMLDIIALYSTILNAIYSSTNIIATHTNSHQFSRSRIVPRAGDCSLVVLIVYELFVRLFLISVNIRCVSTFCLDSNTA